MADTVDRIPSAVFESGKHGTPGCAGPNALQGFLEYLAGFRTGLHNHPKLAHEIYMAGAKHVADEIWKTAVMYFPKECRDAANAPLCKKKPG